MCLHVHNAGTPVFKTFATCSTDILIVEMRFNMFCEVPLCRKLLVTGATFKLFNLVVKLAVALHTTESLEWLLTNVAFYAIIAMYCSHMVL